STIHESYLSAGADIIQANTFGANRLWLGDHGVGDKVAEVNRAGVRIARAAQDRCERDVLVAGSVSPAVTGLQRRRIGSAERAEVIREQIEALLGPSQGVDVLILETFGYLDELVEAVVVASELSDVPIVAQATFADDAHTRAAAVAVTAIPAPRSRRAHPSGTGMSGSVISGTGKAGAPGAGSHGAGSHGAGSHGAGSQGAGSQGAGPFAGTLADQLAGG